MSFGKNGNRGFQRPLKISMTMRNVSQDRCITSRKFSKLCFNDQLEGESTMQSVSLIGARELVKDSITFGANR